MKVWYRLMPALFIALVLDGATKIWAERILELHHPWPLLGDVLRLTLGYNTGVAFGLFANGGFWPLIVTGVVIVGLAIWLTNALRTGEIPPGAGVPIGLLLGGAIANFTDRFMDGRVTDFLDIGLGATRWPAFNLADSFITLSLVYLMIISFNKDHSQSVESRQPDTLL